MTGTLSIVGLYNYDDTIFDNMVVPSELDKDIIIKNILLECAELEILFADSDFFKWAVEQWSKKNAPIWERLYETTQYEYDPLYNRYSTQKEISTIDLQDTDDTHNNFDYSTNAFNENGLVQRDNDVRTHTNLGTDTGTIEKEITMKGNLGLTTVQKMIQEERDIQQFNIYDYIIDDFKQRFCLLVY